MPPPAHHPISPPLVVIDDEGEVELLRSPEAAAEYIPTIELDIWEEFEWYDSEGRRLAIRQEPPPKERRLGPLRLTYGGGPVVVTSIDAEPVHAAELAGHLRTWLGAIAEEPDAPLARLIQLAIDRSGFVS